MTTRGRKKLWALAAVAAVLMAVPAQAVVIANDTSDGGSWTTSWTQSGIAGGFDMIAVQIFSAGDSFVPTEVTGLPAGWSVNFVSPSLVIFSSDGGANVSSLTFTLMYNGTVGVEGAVIETVFASFRDGVLVENLDADRGSGAAFDALSEDLGFDWRGQLNSGRWSDPAGDVGMALVPLPAPIAMGAIGLLGVVLGRKRLRRLAG